MEPLTLTPRAFERIAAIKAERNLPSLRLRLTVAGGGCAGFQYLFSWDDKIAADDHLIGEAVVTDSTSLPFLAGATLDYVVGLMGEDFKITNPNAKSGCGCGTSFSV